MSDGYTFDRGQEIALYIATALFILSLIYQWHTENIPYAADTGSALLFILRGDSE